MLNKCCQKKKKISTSSNLVRFRSFNSMQKNMQINNNVLFYVFLNCFVYCFILFFVLQTFLLIINVYCFPLRYPLSISIGFDKYNVLKTYSSLGLQSIFYTIIIFGHLWYTTLFYNLMCILIKIITLNLFFVFFVFFCAWTLIFQNIFCDFLVNINHNVHLYVSNVYRVCNIIQT